MLKRIAVEVDVVMVVGRIDKIVVFLGQKVGGGDAAARQTKGQGITNQEGVAFVAAQVSAR